MNYFQSIRVQRFAIRTIVITLCFFAVWINAFAADVVYIDKPSGQSYTRQQIRTAVSFYGLEMNVLAFTGGTDRVAALEAIHNSKTVAVVINADVLAVVSKEQLLASIQRLGHGIPLLIVGINEHTSPDLLTHWSSGSITECRRSAVTQTDGRYEVASVSDVTRQLGGNQLPLKQKEVSYLTVDGGRGAQWLIEARFGSVELPIFVRTASGSQEVFFATETQANDIPVTPDPYRQQAVFATLAAPMVFVRYAAGERAWHSPADYANFTIDDLWLREPYGHVNYEELLQESEQHNFHSTVAFIPWNFDRSQSRLVTLFQTHPDRLSICIHGNNHIHQEFGPLETHPVEKQAEDIRQALARMEKFSELTKIRYDTVMVFPHSVSPIATLALLKRYNFLGTANSLNVPSDATAPSDTEFVLRTGSLHFADFPSLRRYSAETDIPKSQLAIDAFLGNPMLFYAHESFFASGIGAFNKIADTVNQLQPDTRWRGLGDIVQHLYLEKLRDDGNFDIRAQSGTIHLFNGNKHDAEFFVEKEEDFALPLKVLVDGEPYPFQRDGTNLRLQLPIRDGMSRLIEIRYGSELNLAAIAIAKSSPKTTALRLLSDFRDNEVSNTALGRRFIRSYVDYGSDWNRGMTALGGLVALVAAFFYVRRDRKGSLAPRASASRQNS
jgi:hypothetical protein